jgi:hypothetical protein
MLLEFRLAVIALAGAFLMTAPQHVPPLCHARSDLVGKCFSVHGALRYWNGGTPVRIWRIGTTRVLGVRGLDEVGLPRDSTACPLPAGLRDTLQAGKEVIADFVVCPLTRDRPGSMQYVCVDAATNIRAKPYRF